MLLPYVSTPDSGPTLVAAIKEEACLGVQQRLADKRRLAPVLRGIRTLSPADPPKSK